MFERIRRGWNIVHVSWASLKQHPGLLILPVLSGLATLALVVSIALSVFSNFEELEQLTQYFENEYVVYGVLFAFYFAVFFITIFFNSALVRCTFDIFAGRQPSAWRGLAASVRLLPQILAWTLLAATFGMALNFLQSTLEDKLGFFGGLLGGLPEFAWAVATYFVIPVLVAEGVWPIEAVKRSSSILKRTWGESLVGEGGLGIISFLFVLPVPLLIAVAGSAGIGTGNGGMVLAAVAVVYFAAMTVVFTALGTTATYVYATTDEAPQQMNETLLRGSFRHK